MDQTQDIQATNTLPTPKPANHSWRVWLTALLTIIAWATLVWINGYGALAIAAVSLGCGIWAMKDNHGAVRKLNIAAIIASTILIVVLLAFLIVIKIGLQA